MIRFRPTVAEVDLGAIRRNVRALKPAGAALMAVVKSDGYGHGDVPVARAALAAGASWLGVALVEEGIRLREAGIDAPILVLTEFPPGSEKDALAAGLSPSAYSDDGLAALAEAARAVGRPAGLHVKVDTGMHRVGLSPERAVAFVRTALDAGLGFEGLWSHFAVADEPGHPSVARQQERFESVSSALAGEGLVPAVRHMANTAATILLPEAHYDLVRVGIGTYGLPAGPGVDDRISLRPSLRWVSSVTATRRVAVGEGVSYGHRFVASRETTIATVCVGYGDGYARALSDRGEVLIRGRRHPVAGTVTMDQTMIDVGDEPVEPGDEVVLIGRQGDEEIRAEDVAGRLGTIAYEVVCAISDRVPREYVGEAG